MKADLHVHSKFSTRPSQWLLQKVGCPESFTEPAALYRIARRRGMSLVTITDHNRIEGALEIAHLPHTFISEEISSYFPQDHCKVHVLAYNINEGHHAEIQKCRSNVFDLVAYLQNSAIPHALAHPLFALNDRLTLDHFEQALLLFKNFELNGDCNADSNRILIEESFLAGIESGQAEAIQREPSPQSMAHNICSIAYQFYCHKLGLGKYVLNDLIVKHIDRSLRPLNETEAGLKGKLRFRWKYRQLKKLKNTLPSGVAGILRKEASQYIHRCKKKEKMDSKVAATPVSPETQWFRFVSQISNVALVQFGNQLFSRFAGADLFNIFHTIGSAGGFYTLMAPYFVAYSQYSRQRQLSNVIQSGFASAQGRVPPDLSPKIAVFVDVKDHFAGNLNSDCCKRMGTGHKSTGVTLITCRNGQSQTSGRNGWMNFKSIGACELESDTHTKIYYPPLMDILDYCYQQKFSHIHLSSCGTVGLTGLFIARLLKLPTTTTYQASLLDEVRNLTSDEFMEELAWKYLAWFYNQIERAFIPSTRIRRRLVRHGVQPSKLNLVPEAVELDSLMTDIENNVNFIRGLILNHRTIPFDGIPHFDRTRDSLDSQVYSFGLEKAPTRISESRALF